MGAALVRGTLGLLALLGLAGMSALDLPLAVWAFSAGAWMLASMADGRWTRAPSQAGAAPGTIDCMEVNDAG